MYEPIVELMSQFILNGDALNQSIYENAFKQKPLTVNSNKNITNNNKNIFINNDLYIVRQRDSLFWTFYILKNGLAKYEMYASKRYFTIEQEEKFKYIELIRKNKKLIKDNKFKNILNLETELGNNCKINIKMYFLLCLIENIKTIIVDGRKIYSNVNIENNDIENENIQIVIKNNKYNNYTIDFDNSKEKILNYLDNYLIVSPLDDKLKSISSYKVSELIDMCQKLNIKYENSNKKSKQELYSLICEKYN